jgi:hypothetical protein
MLSWLVATKSKWLLDQRNTWAYALIVKPPWKLFGLLQLRSHWYDSWWKRKWNRRWTLGRVLLTNLQDQRQPLGSRGGTLGRKSRAGYLTSTWRYPSLTCNQRQAQKMILGPSLATKTTLLSHSRTQYRMIKGLLTRHNTITRHLYMKRLIESPWLGSAEQRK